MTVTLFVILLEKKQEKHLCLKSKLTNICFMIYYVFDVWLKIIVVFIKTKKEETDKKCFFHYCKKSTQGGKYKPRTTTHQHYFFSRQAWTKLKHYFTKYKPVPIPCIADDPMQALFR